MGRFVETIVIGGGQAGLAMSYHLSKASREHIVVERARIAESWRTERWDSLMFQFPNWSIKLPGHAFKQDAPDGFATKESIVNFIENYARLISAPVQCDLNVLRLRFDDGSQRFVVQTQTSQWQAQNVIIATGSYHSPVLPTCATSISRKIFQIHTRDYKNPRQLPPGHTLIVGSGASGTQIAEELLQSGRRVYLSVGRHDKVPRRYREKDLYWWLDAMGVWRMPLEKQPEMRVWRPLFTGMAGGHDIDLSRLAANGMVLLGRLKDADGQKLSFASDLADSLTKSQLWFESFRPRIDDYARELGDHLSIRSDAKHSKPVVSLVSGSTELLELSDEGIGSIIWAGGFRYNFDWVDLPVFDVTGEPLARRGVSVVPGLYFLGLRRTYAVGSSLLAGVGDEAAYLAEHIAAKS